MPEREQTAHRSKQVGPFSVLRCRLRPHRIRAAPKNAWVGDVAGDAVEKYAGLKLASVIAARSLTCRSVKLAGQARTQRKSFRALTARAHLTKLAHRSRLCSPVIVHGLVRSRTSARFNFSTPNNASAHAIALPE